MSDDIIGLNWPTPERVSLAPFRRMKSEMEGFVSFIKYGTADPHEIFVARLRERTTPMFIISHDESTDAEVVEYIEQYVSRMRARPMIAEGGFSVGIDVGMHPDEYLDRLEFYDQPCMYAEGD